MTSGCYIRPPLQEGGLGKQGKKAVWVVRVMKVMIAHPALAIALALTTAPEIAAGLPFAAELRAAQATIAAKRMEWRDFA
jgi:hypothetical protein